MRILSQSSTDAGPPLDTKYEKESLSEENFWTVEQHFQRSGQATAATLKEVVFERLNGEKGLV